MDNNFKKIFENLKLVKFENDEISKQERGRVFEKLILDILESEDANCIVKRSYYTSDNSSEQIDGAIRLVGRVVLIETKWQESNLAASALYSFLGKIENKFLGTVGMFISRVELSENFIRALSKGRRQIIVVLHGKDIDDLFKSNYKLIEYFAYAIEQLSIDNRIHIPFAEFEEVIAIKKQVESKMPGTNIVADIFDATKDTLTIAHSSSIDNSENQKAYILFVQNSSATFQRVKTSADKDRLRTFLENFLAASKEKQKRVFEYLQQYLKEDEKSRLSDDVYTNPILSHYLTIDKQARIDFENHLADVFLRKYGNYDYENYLTILIRSIWPHLSVRQPYFNLYIEIYLSSRTNKYPNKQFANTILSNTENVQEYFIPWLKQKFLTLRKLYDEESEEQVLHLLINKSSPLMTFIKMGKEDWEKFVRSAIK